MVEEGGFFDFLKKTFSGRKVDTAASVGNSTPLEKAKTPKEILDEQLKARSESNRTQLGAGAFGGIAHDIAGASGGEMTAVSTEKGVAPVTIIAKEKSLPIKNLTINGTGAKANTK